MELPTNHSSESGTVVLELDVDILDAVVDHAHRIGRKAMDANGMQGNKL